MSTSADGPDPRRGVWLFPGAGATALVAAVEAAEAAGLDEVWIADEGVGREPTTVLAAAAERTDRIRLGVGVTSPLLRHPGAIAATLATLDELSDGRAVLGLGVGGGHSLDPFGLSTDRPVGVVKDAIAIARAVFGRVPTAGYRPPDHSFGPRPVPIWIGSRGPQLTALAAREADGIFLSGCTEQQHIEIVERVRTIRPIEIALYQSASSVDRRDSVVDWDEVGDRLAVERARHRPAAIGINLVDLIGNQHDDPVALVHRAASVLDAV